jgi:hypothetical protein
MKALDLVGQRFGKLVVLERAPMPATAKRKLSYWRCACDCGGERTAHSNELRAGTASQCGCDPLASMSLNLVGQRFGKLTVVKLAERGGGSRAGRRWLCKCDCGNDRIMSSGHLREGKVIACHECGKKTRYERAYETKLLGMHAEDGQRFGGLRVIGPARDKDGCVKRLCACRCGRFFIAPLHSIKSGRIKNCQKCLGRTRWARYWKTLRNEERGKQYNELTVLHIVAGVPYKNYSGKRTPYAICNCSCGTKNFRVMLCSLKTGNTKACGCKQHVFPEHMKGPNHPWYRHDLTDEERTAMRVFEGQDAFRSSIYSRDDYTCQACGERGGKLAAHHIKPWAYFEGQRFLKRNLVTLCHECHGYFHTIYGKRDALIWKEFFPWVREVRKETGYKHS